MTTRTIITDKRRKNFSKRAAEGTLSVERRQCPKCGHHKAFVTNGRIKCTRCKFIIQK